MNVAKAKYFITDSSQRAAADAGARVTFNLPKSEAAFHSKVRV